MTTDDRTPSGRPLVEVVLPAYNEEEDLPRSVETLVGFLRGQPQWAWRVLVADNASTDGTLAAAEALAEEYPEVEAFHLPQKGRGRALRAAWLRSDADAVCYMDVDLSTDLSALRRSSRRCWTAATTSPSGRGWRGGRGCTSAR